MSQKQNQINIELSDEISKGKYANLAMIAHSSSEFVIDFIQLMPGVPKAKVNSRIIITPEHAKKFSIAYRTAERLSENLFDEVTAQTKNAVDQKNRALASEKEVSNLLNNMKQSVFSINEEGLIIPPVSRFSHELFEKSIEGESAFQILFKDYDQSGELIGGLRFFLKICVGADDFQYQLMSEQLPKKIKLSKENKFKN